jgi:hypothetical protein
MMVNDKRDYWVFGLVHHPIFYRRLKITTFRKLDTFSSRGEVMGDAYSVGSDRKS